MRFALAVSPTRVACDAACRQRTQEGGGGDWGRWRGPFSRGEAGKGPRQARNAAGAKGSGRIGAKRPKTVISQNWGRARTMRDNARLPPVLVNAGVEPFFALPVRLLGFQDGIGQK